MFTIQIEVDTPKGTPDKLPGKYKYAHIHDPNGGEPPSAEENYRQIKAEWQAEQEWQKAIQQALEDAMGDYFDKR